MDILSFLLRIAGNSTQALIADFIRGEGSKQSVEQQRAHIGKLLADEIAQHWKTLDSKPAPDCLARLAMEQLLVLAHDPDYPLKLKDDKFVLRNELSRKPLLTKAEKWQKQETETRLWRLEQTIRKRLTELEQLPGDLPRIEMDR